MARTKQRLINYHTSGNAMPNGSDVHYGEIVVRHNPENPELLIKVGEESFGVFQASGAVNSAIEKAVNAAKAEVNGSISTLEQTLSAHTADFEAFQEEVENTFATKTELTTAKTNITDAYTQAVADAKAEAISDAKEYTDTKVAAAKGELNQEINKVQSNLDTLGERVDGISTNIGANYVSNTALNAYKEQVTSDIKVAKENAISDAKAYTDTEVAGAKGYTDEKILAEEGRVNSLITGVQGSVDSLDDKVDAISGHVKSVFSTKTELSDAVNTLTGNIATAKSEAIDAAKGYTNTEVAAAKGYTDTEVSEAEARVNQTIVKLDSKVDTVSGNIETTINSVKGELVETINNKVAVAYRYAGSCTYAKLPASGSVIGEVWNVTDANGNFPAGTNYAWTGSEWDALGGSVDLSPYAKTADVNASLQSTNQSVTTLRSDLEKVSAATDTLVDNLKDYADDTFATKTALQTAQSNITTAYTKAVADAKAEAISDANGYTDTEVAAAKGELSQNINGVDSKVNTLSAATVTIQTTANSAIQSASADTASKVSIKKEGTALKFDFSELVIDCGDF